MKNLVLFGIFSLAALSVSAQELLMSEPQDDWVHYNTSQYGGKISEKYTQGSVLEAVQSGSPSLTVLPSSESNMRTKAVEKDA